MPDEKLSELIERVERASGPERELDGLIAEACGEPRWLWYARATTLDKLKLRDGVEAKVKVALYYSEEGGGWWQWGPEAWRQGRRNEDEARASALTAGPWFHKPEPDEIRVVQEVDPDCPAFTASLDACLALVERVRPGWGWQVIGGSLAKVATLFRPPKNPEGSITDSDSWSVPFEGAAATSPLAVLSALLRSMGEKT